MKPPIGQRLLRRVERMLQKLSLKYMLDEDQDVQLVMSGEELPIRLRILILREGPLREILAFLVRFEGEIPPFSEEEAIHTANQWNTLRRWPRIYWREGYFYGDMHIDGEFDIPQSVLELQFKHFLSGSLQFALQLTGQEKELFRRIWQQLFQDPRLN